MIFSGEVITNQQIVNELSESVKRHEDELTKLSSELDEAINSNSFDLSYTIERKITNIKSAIWHKQKQINQCL
jgi:uncharacterized FlaG/YvyC family protein